MSDRPPDHPTGAAAGPPPPPPPPTGRYEFGDEIARGGMGVVYQATDTALGREVAVKVLQYRFGPVSTAARRFADEARIAGGLQHPGIPPVHDLGALPDGRPFLAMKLVKGRTLDDLLKDRPDPAADRGRFVAVFEGVCQAVGFAHAHGVVHRDLKPANVMVGNFGEVQVMDWGLAKVLASRADYDPTENDDTTGAGTEIRSLREADDATRAGLVLGTPAYMPPEQAIGAVDQIDARSDVFGLGAVLCAILTGKPPYVGADRESTRQLAARAKLDDALARLDGSGADPELVALCRRCLAVEKTNRPADAGTVAGEVARLRAAADDRARQADLDRVRAEGDLKAAEVQATEQRRKRRWQRAAVATVGLLLAGGGAFAWWEDNRAGARRTEAAATEARARQAVESAIALSTELREKFRFAEARTALDQAAELIPAEAPADIRDRIDRARDDLELVRELDAIRISRVSGAEYRTYEEVTAEYRTAFRARGVDPSEADPAATADWVAASEVKRELVVALDDWAWMIGRTKEGRGARDRLLAATRRADPGPWSDRLRDPAAWLDEAAMDRLTADMDVPAVPPGLFVLFCQQRTQPWVGARQLMRTVATRYPEDFWVQFEAGHYFAVKDRDPAAAVGFLSAARAVRPNNGKTVSQLGFVLRDAGDLDGAIGCFRFAVRLDPRSASSHHILGTALRSKGDLAGAAECEREVLRLEPKYFARFNLEQGQTLYHDKDFAGAAAALRKAIQIDNTDATAYDYLGRVLYSRRDWVGAVAAYREAVRLGPADVRRHKMLGRALLADGDPDGAAASFREAVGRDPKDDENHYYLGYALRQAGDLGGAVASHREAVRLAPQVAIYYHSLGYALRQAGDLGGAVASHREAVRLAPDDADNHLYLGLALRDSGDLDGAVTAHRDAARLDPDYAEELKGAERDRELLPRLPAVAGGRADPASPAEACEMADLCTRPFLKQYVLATRLFAQAFAGDPKLATEINTGHRYNAACAAALAAAGKDAELTALGMDEWGQFTDLAYRWLRADLAVLSATAKVPRNRAPVRRTLTHWLADSDLAAVRDPASLAAMPLPDCRRWQALWADVAVAIASTRPAVAPPPREVAR